MWFIHSPLLFVLFLLNAVQALTWPQNGFPVQNILQILGDVHYAQNAPTSWQWPWQSGDETFKRFWDELPQVYNKATNFAQNGLEDLIHSHPEVLSKIKQLEQAGQDLIHATSQFDFAHLDGDEKFAEKWERVVEAVYAKLQEEFPSPDKAPSHAERREMVRRALVLIEDQFIIHVGPHLRMDEEHAREKFGKFRKIFERFMVLIGDLIEQHPYIAGAILLWIIGLVIVKVPCKFFLRSILGFTAEGPGKGSAAAWIQRCFYGGFISKGSVFSFLQKLNAGTFMWPIF